MGNTQFSKTSADEPEISDILRLRWGWWSWRSEALHGQIRTPINADRQVGIGFDMVKDVYDQLVGESKKSGRLSRDRHSREQKRPERSGAGKSRSSRDYRASTCEEW